MTAQTLASTVELTPLADFLAGVLKRIHPLPPLDLDLTQAYGNVLASDVRAPTPLPPFDRAAIDGYAARWEDVLSAAPDRTVRLDVVGDLSAASWRPVRVAPGTCFAVAAGAPLPAAADVVIPPRATDQGMAAVEIRERQRRGSGVRRAGDELALGTVLAKAGSYVTPALIAVLASTGVCRVMVRPSPRVAVISTGDELVEAGRASRPGQVVDANSHALAAAAAEAGAHAYRIGICDDDPEALHNVLGDQFGQADLIVTTGGTNVGPGDLVRRILGRDGSVRFTEVSLTPCTTMGEGMLSSLPLSSRQLGSVLAGGEDLPVICLPGDPGAALIGFEVLARPVIQKLAGAEPVFRPSVKAHLLETLNSPLGLREFRPAAITERRGGGYTAQPLPGGPYTLSGLAAANGLIVLGERVGTAPAGSTVDVLMLDRRR
jgi:molybdopterin molybdotransferase